VAEYFEEKYDYTVPLALPKPRRKGEEAGRREGVGAIQEEPEQYDSGADEEKSDKREIPVWTGVDKLVSQEVRIVGPNGEKVDVMTFRGAFEKDLQAFAEENPDLRQAVEQEDDDAVETILQERFYHRPEHFYAQDKLMQTYGVPASTPEFVYGALGKRPLPTKSQIVEETVSSIAAQHNLRYAEQKWLAATAALVADDPAALEAFEKGEYSVVFGRSQFQRIGGMAALAQFGERESVFESLRQSRLVRATRAWFNP
jgi:hypothetical protein